MFQCLIDRRELEILTKFREQPYLVSMSYRQTGTSFIILSAVMVYVVSMSYRQTGTSPHPRLLISPPRFQCLIDRRELAVVGKVISDWHLVSMSYRQTGTSCRCVCIQEVDKVSMSYRQTGTRQGRRRYSTRVVFQCLIDRRELADRESNRKRVLSGFNVL